MSLPTDGKFKPNGVETQCQCVWNHNDPQFFITIKQCKAPKGKDQNRFCTECEYAHGDTIRARETASE